MNIGVSEGPYVLALDIGTSSARALLFDREGELVPGAKEHYSYLIPTRNDGAVEAEPHALCEAVYQCIDGCLEKAGELVNKIQGVGTCAFASSVLGIGPNGKPVSPVYTYADSRPQLDVAALRKEMDEDAVQQRTGTRFHTSYLAPRFRWLQREYPDVFQKAVRWMAFAEYLYLQLFGETASSFSLASWSGLEDCRRLTWDVEVLKAVGMSPDQLLTLRDANQPMQGLRSPFKERWPSLANLPWFLPVGDGAAANIGSGCATPRQVAVTIGTTSAVRAVMPEPPGVIPYGLWCYRVSERKALLGGALIEGGNLFAWFRQMFDANELSDIEETLEESTPDGHGLTFLPTVGGERNPGWNAEARGVIAGLTLATRPMDVIQAGLEGLACRVAQIYEILRKILPDEPEVIASGGAVGTSSYLHALLADVIGKPVALAGLDEASARGAALLALEALGVINETQKLTVELREIKRPDENRVVTYRKVRERVEELYSRMYADFLHPFM